MTTQEVLNELEGYGDENTKKIYTKHGAQEPFYGVKVADLKKILKKTKKDHSLALDLYATGNSDAMYLAGLMADEKQMTKADLKVWLKGAYWYFLSEFTVAWVAAETEFAFELGTEWIESDNPVVSCAGWATLSCATAVKEDTDLDIAAYSKLLDRIEKEVHSQPDRVPHAMNAFVIAVGTGIKELTDKAMAVANSIGKVQVNMGDTSCKTPPAGPHIQKVIERGAIGKKRKTARC